MTRTGPAARPTRRATAPLGLGALTLTVVAALLLSACGFHLRGSYRIPERLTPLYLDAPADSGIARALRDTLRSQGTELADERAAAAASLAVLDESEDRRVLSVDSSARVNEYEIRKSVRWQLVEPAAADQSDREADKAGGRAGRTLIAPSRLRARRDYEFDPSGVLSKANEERALYADMEQALARQILARLQAWSPDGA